jgi:Aspartyl protease
MLLSRFLYTPMKTRLVTLLLVATFSAFAAGQEGKPAVSVPFTIAADTNLLMIPSASPGGPSFALDTGGGVSVLAKGLVEKLGGKSYGTFTGFRLTGERLDLELFKVPELRVGPIVQKEVVVAGWDGLDKLHLDGIIGLDFFRAQPITVDFVHHQLIFETSVSLAQRRIAGRTVALRLDDQRGVSLTPFARFRVGSRSAECEIDTGSQGYILNLRYMKQLGIDPNSSAVKRSEYTTILGNKELRYTAAVPTPSLKGIPAVAGESVPALFEEIIYDCNVGIQYWAGRIVTFDVPNKVLLVSTK